MSMEGLVETRRVLVEGLGCASDPRRLLEILEPFYVAVGHRGSLG